MKEAKWLTSKNGERLLVEVGAHLSERKCDLLACALLRRVHQDFSKPFADMATAIELQATNPKLLDREQLVLQLERSEETLTRDATARQHQLLRNCLPDGPDDATLAVRSRTANPVDALLQGSATAALRCIEQLEEGLYQITTALRCVLDETPRLDKLATMLPRTLIALETAEYAHRQMQLNLVSAQKQQLKAEDLTERLTARNRRVVRVGADNMANSLSLQLSEQIERCERQTSRWFQRQLADVVRDQLGNPYRPYTFAEQWRTETVRTMAHGITHEGAFDRMPFLADALEEAGCDRADLLAHARKPQQHTRGCWVLDLILHPDESTFQAEPLKPRAVPRGRSQQLGRFSSPPEEMY